MTDSISGQVKTMQQSGLCVQSSSVVHRPCRGLGVAVHLGVLLLQEPLMAYGGTVHLLLGT